MNKIKLLSEDVIRKIAAGEVVERPASVVKELLENALDAGATSISLSWQTEGPSLTVADNGCGMSPEDARLALERHATSKISRFEDLFSVRSFGFRGEALPSIASVSKLEILTRTETGEAGWKLETENGSIRAQGPAGRARGTTVTVRDLFHNTPARAKFQKSDATERRHVMRTIEELALAHPETAFSLEIDGKKTFSLPATSLLAERIQDLLGSAFFKTLTPVSAVHRFASLRGFFSKPDATQAGRGMQFLFINNRPVVHKSLQHALYQGAQDILMTDRHPAYVLFLDVDPQSVDVNAHPSKREVRLSEERPLHEFLASAVKQAVQVPEAVPAYSHASNPAPMAAESSLPYQADLGVLLSQSMAVPLESFTPPSASFPEIEILAQANQLYAVGQSAQELFLIDQHAAQERILFEAFLESASSSAVPSQELLFPFSWDLSWQEAAVIQESLSSFQELGFRIEPFGQTSFVVKALPAPLAKLKDARSALGAILSELMNGASAVKIPWRERIATAACRAAVKAGDPLGIQELKALLKDLQKCEAPLTCPHGRPTMIRLSFDELARRFRRT